MLGVLSAPVSATASTNYLGGDTAASDILKVTVGNQGGVFPERWDSVNDQWVRQYYSTPSSDGGAGGNGLVLFANGQRMMVGGNKSANFGSASPSGATFAVTQTVLNGTVEQITRTWTGTGSATGITINETFTLARGSNSYGRAVQIVNNTGSTLTDVRLIIGGDTYFAGDDSGYANWDSVNRSVYILKDETSGNMAFSGRNDTPADRFFAGRFSDGASLALAGNLNNFASGPSTRVDTSYYLQWGNGSVNLPAGASRTFHMTEAIGAPGALQIVPPASQVLTPGATAVLQFLLQNVTSGAEADELDNLLAVMSAQGWTPTLLPTTATLAAGEELPVAVSVTVPAATVTGTTDMITLQSEYTGATFSGITATSVQLTVSSFVVETIAPDEGTTLGGDTITISGSGMANITGVLFGNVSATDMTLVDANTLEITTPAHAAGTVDLVFTDATGQIVLYDAFTFVPPFTVASISPVEGPVEGGTHVTITGTGLDGITWVKFGEVETNEIEHVDATTVKVVTPAHALGTVDVTVGNGETEYVFAQGFSYVPGVPNTAGFMSAVAVLGGGFLVATILLFLTTNKKENV
jgi:hypothetical protein